MITIHDSLLMTRIRSLLIALTPLLVAIALVAGSQTSPQLVAYTPDRINCNVEYCNYRCLMNSNVGQALCNAVCLCNEQDERQIERRFSGRACISIDFPNDYDSECTAENWDDMNYWDDMNDESADDSSDQNNGTQKCCQRGTCVGVGGSSGYLCAYGYTAPDGGGGTRYSATACTPATQSADCVECATCSSDQVCDGGVCRAHNEQEEQAERCRQAETDFASAEIAHDAAQGTWDEAQASWEDAQGAWDDAKDAYAEVKTSYKEAVNGCKNDYAQSRSDCADEETTAEKKACLASAKSERTACLSSAKAEALEGKSVYVAAQAERKAGKSAYAAAKIAWRSAERTFKAAQKTHDKATKACEE